MAAMVIAMQHMHTRAPVPHGVHTTGPLMLPPNMLQMGSVGQGMADNSSYACPTPNHGGPQGTQVALQQPPTNIGIEQTRLGRTVGPTSGGEDGMAQTQPPAPSAAQPQLGAPTGTQSGSQTATQKQAGTDAPAALTRLERKSENKSESLGKRKNSEIDTKPSKKYNSSDRHYRFTGDSPVATLSNMGNTCFLNSVLYTLRFTPTFLHNLHHLIGDLTLINSQNRAKSSSLGCNTKSISGPSSRSTNSKDLPPLGNCHVISKPKQPIVTEKLHELFITMHNLELQGSGDACQPLAFLELLVYLLDNIRDTCFFLNQRSREEVIQNENHTNGSNNSNKKIGYNFVAEDFGGVTIRRTKCLECGGVTEKKELFYDILVSILYNEDKKTDPSEIYRKACVTSEKLSNGYLCDTCERSNEASREVLFEKLPNIMVLQLKRITVTVAGVNKVHTYFPTPLELKCFCESCCQLENGLSLHRYQLCCVIRHLGQTMESGHYISYIKVTDYFEDYTESSETDSTIGMCKSIDCCGIKLNKDIVQNVANSNATNNAQEKWQQSSMDVSGDMWLECDDENVRLITNNDFQDLLSDKPNPRYSTPYLLFYSKITDIQQNLSSELDDTFIAVRGGDKDEGQELSTTLVCRAIRIGSYRYIPSENVQNKLDMLKLTTDSLNSLIKELEKELTELKSDTTVEGDLKKDKVVSLRIRIELVLKAVQEHAVKHIKSYQPN